MNPSGASDLYQAVGYAVIVCLILAAVLIAWALWRREDDE